MNAIQTIEALGGTVKVARALGVPPTTVSSWKTGHNRIPRWRSREIAELAAEWGVPLPTDTTP